MSMRAYIAVQNRNTLAFRGAYVHNDGGSLLPTLEEHYASANKRAALLKLGHLSQLHASTACPAGHSFDTPVAGHCVAYGRDRGDTDCATDELPTLAAVRAFAFDMDADYLYVHMYGRWDCWRVTREAEFTAITKERQA